MINQKYTAVIVGCGRIGCGFDDDPKRKYIATHAKAYATNPKINLSALVDVNTELSSKYAKLYNVTNTYTDFSQMLEQEHPDIISICTWNNTHLPLVEQAVKYGVKAIFCEKPISNSINNAKKMLQLCQEHQIILMIDHQRRFDPTHLEAKKFIEQGNLGRVQQANCRYTAGIANTGSHMFDLLRFMLGEVEWVQALESENKSPNIIDPNFDGLIKFKKGVLCTMQAFDVKDYLLFELEILGTKGKIVITNSGFNFEYFQAEESELFSGYKELIKTELPFKKYQVNFMVDAVNHLVECLDKNNKPICSGEDGLAALELICAFHESANQEGKRIYLPLKESKITIESR